LIDTTTSTEELIGWSPAYNKESEMPPWLFGGNSPIDKNEAAWHSEKEAVALSVGISRRATTVWIWEHQHGVEKLDRSKLIKLLHPKGKTDEPNPLTTEIKGWNGDELLVSEVAWSVSQHKWRAISTKYQRKFDE
jgi:hypothetical protein